MSKRIANNSIITNFDWFMDMNPRHIIGQEKQGQQELVESNQLPRYVNHDGKYHAHRGKEANESYLKMGIEVLRVSKDDELFVDVILPEGWKVQNTSHSMWSSLVDQDGKEVGSIFYKASFHDRDAFININE